MILVLAGLAAYLLGSFPSGVVVGRLWRGVDIRGQGSGNPGTANVLRVLGPLPAVLVFVLDCGKGFAAAVLPARLCGPDCGWLGGLMAVVGHVYPVYVGFRGGKGLATGGGAIAVLAPWFLAVFAPVWAAVYLWRRKVALASDAAILAVAFATILAAALGYLGSWPLAASLVGLGIIFWRHWPEAKKGLAGGVP